MFVSVFAVAPAPPLTMPRPATLFLFLHRPPFFRFALYRCPMSPRPRLFACRRSGGARQAAVATPPYMIRAMSFPFQVRQQRRRRAARVSRGALRRRFPRRRSPSPPFRRRFGFSARLRAADARAEAAPSRAAYVRSSSACYVYAALALRMMILLLPSPTFAAALPVIFEFRAAPPPRRVKAAAE